MEMDLAVPLMMSQIEAAKRLHGKLIQWQITDCALHKLKEQFPGFDRESVLLTGVAVNQLYGTNVYAVERMVGHVSEVMCHDSTMDDVSIVNELAEFDCRKYVSFPSRFAHFFVEAERFPIYDSYAVKTLVYHLGEQGLVRDRDNPYKAFVANFHQLKRVAELECTTRELDHYLWLAGMYRKWKTKAMPEVNREFEELFNVMLPGDVPVPPLLGMLPSEFANLKCN